MGKLVLRVREWDSWLHPLIRHEVQGEKLPFPSYPYHLWWEKKLILSLTSYNTWEMGPTLYLGSPVKLTLLTSTDI